MILAAGKGTRMGSLTAARPKPLLELNGMMLIGRQLRRLAAGSIRDVVINLSYRGDMIRAAVGDGSRFGVRVIYAEEGPEPLETAGGIINALPLLGDSPFLVVNADVVSDFEFGDLALGDALGTLVLVPNPPHSPRGDYGIDATSVLTHDEPKYTFAGISLLSPALFAGLAPGRRPLSQVFEHAIRSRSLRGQIHAGLWFDVGTADRLAEASAALELREAT
ncbi:MAG TPA: nucleotidyltransferase family protein [Gammaproteobacteria bacterium]